jgi:hypothetical protein
MMGILLYLKWKGGRINVQMRKCIWPPQLLSKDQVNKRARVPGKASKFRQIYCLEYQVQRSNSSMYTVLGCVHLLGLKILWYVTKSRSTSKKLL